MCPVWLWQDGYHVDRTLAYSLTELSSNVVISQMGHFLVGNHNQVEVHPILHSACTVVASRRTRAFS